MATRRAATLADGRVLAHAPRLPHADKAEAWVVALVDARGRVRGVRPAPPLPGGVAWAAELKVRFGAAEVGGQALRVLAVCGAYEGADATADVRVEVLPPADVSDDDGDGGEEDASDGVGEGSEGDGEGSEDEDLDDSGDSEEE